jgi:hypothetical protein
VLAKARACAPTTRMNATEFLEGAESVSAQVFLLSKNVSGHFFLRGCQSVEELVFLLSIVFKVTYCCWLAARARRHHSCMHLQASTKRVVAFKKKKRGKFCIEGT